MDPHWEFDAIWLGADVYGARSACRRLLLAKPTRAFTATADHVALIPTTIGGWPPSADRRGAPIRVVYVDITTPAEGVHY
ncbi:MAG: hypothetical protein R2693_07330 [Nocardioidaceae bacterium]